MARDSAHLRAGRAILLGRVAALVLLGSLCASCTDAESRANGPQFAITVSTATDSPGSSIFGVLHGDFSSGCLWLSPKNGKPLQIHLVGDYHLEWPGREPQIYEHGRLLASGGDEVSFATTPPKAEFAIRTCPVTPDAAANVH
jgi:hypothetical protein